MLNHACNARSRDQIPLWCAGSFWRFQKNSSKVYFGHHTSSTCQSQGLAPQAAGWSKHLVLASSSVCFVLCWAQISRLHTVLVAKRGAGAKANKQLWGFRESREAGVHRGLPALLELGMRVRLGFVCSDRRSQCLGAWGSLRELCSQAEKEPSGRPTGVRAWFACVCFSLLAVVLSYLISSPPRVWDLRTDSRRMRGEMLGGGRTGGTWKGRTGVSTWRSSGGETMHHTSMCWELPCVPRAWVWGRCPQLCSQAGHCWGEWGISAYPPPLPDPRESKVEPPLWWAWPWPWTQGFQEGFSSSLVIRNSWVPWWSHFSVLWAIYPSAKGGCFHCDLLLCTAVPVLHCVQKQGLKCTNQMTSQD